MHITLRQKQDQTPKLSLHSKGKGAGILLNLWLWVQAAELNYSQLNTVKLDIHYQNSAF